MKRKSIVLTIVTFMIHFYSAHPSQAETIKLKMGDVFQAEIVEQNDKLIKVKRLGLVITYFRDEIESIFSEPPASQKPNNVSLDRKLIGNYDEELNIFLVNVERIEKKVDDYLEGHSDQLNGLLNNGQNDEAMDIVLQETNLINEAVKLLRKISVPLKAQKLKEVMITYYESMLQTQAAFLKLIVDGPEKSYILEEKTQAMARLEKDFLLEFNRLKSASRAPSAPPIEIVKKHGSPDEQTSEYEHTLQKIQNENDVLIEETKGLVKANKELQQNMRSMQAEIKKIKEDLIVILKAALEYSTEEQKGRFLSYLQAI